MLAKNLLRRSAQLVGVDYCKKFLQRKVDVISLFSGVECGMRLGT